jgi:lauroyl/myristoyl acyltransferase
MLGATSAAPFPSFPRPRSHASSPACGTISGAVAAEYPHLRKIRVFEPGGCVETHGFEHVHQAVAAKRRMIFVSGHIANWEIAALAAVQSGISVA